MGRWRAHSGPGGAAVTWLQLWSGYGCDDRRGPTVDRARGCDDTGDPAACRARAGGGGTATTVAAWLPAVRTYFYDSSSGLPLSKPHGGPA